jgi:hypothetical protein
MIYTTIRIAKNSFELDWGAAVWGINLWLASELQEVVLVLFRTTVRKVQGVSKVSQDNCKVRAMVLTDN